MHRLVQLHLIIYWKTTVSCPLGPMTTSFTTTFQSRGGEAGRLSFREVVDIDAEEGAENSPLPAAADTAFKAVTRTCSPTVPRTASDRYVRIPLKADALLVKPSLSLFRLSI
mmetsp:Transcript_4264/g.6780  ORF Transcript_4264/g.6780 Transcript_4264/m.6780 type:complete len:112 (-) Transcript_4264:1146-1481(-)